MAGEKIRHEMTEEEQAAVWAEVSAHSQQMGPKSTALLARTQTITLTLEGSLMRALPEWMEFEVTATKNSSGDGYYVSSFEFDADLADIFEEINLPLFKERLARHVMQNCEDIFLSSQGLDWRQ